MVEDKKPISEEIEDEVEVVEDSEEEE